ncbi:hypothetical protein G6F40_017382 [Rhizopus arrhizus]|nr:hypothetical protein G6F40_017382 [Rhizopus arrhizus]
MAPRLVSSQPRQKRVIWSDRWVGSTCSRLAIIRYVFSALYASSTLVGEAAWNSMSPALARTGCAWGGAAGRVPAAAA